MVNIMFFVYLVSLLRLILSQYVEIYYIITVTPTQPSDTSQYFTIYAATFDQNWNWIWDYNVPITVSLYSGSALTGTLTQYTAWNGIAYFGDVRSVYLGTWYMCSFAPGYNGWCTGWFTISTGDSAFNSVVISLSNTSPGVFLPFTVTATALDSYGYTMLNPCTMTISEDYGNAITGTTSAYITGSTSFSIYFSTTGSMIVRGTCSYGTGTQGMTVQSNVITITSVSPTVFTM